MCPVREADWIDGSDPIAVFSQSGLAEPDYVFLTSAAPSDAVWYISRHEPDVGYVEMIKITLRLTACKLSIQLCPTAGGSQALVSYCHTSLVPAGDAFDAAFTEDCYTKLMQNWEPRLKHYLVHGAALLGLDTWFPDA